MRFSIVQAVTTREGDWVDMRRRESWEEISSVVFSVSAAVPAGEEGGER